MKTIIAYVVTWILVFLSVFMFAGEPDPGYERLHWASILIVSQIFMIPVYLFHTLMLIAREK